MSRRTTFRKNLVPFRWTLNVRHWTWNPEILENWLYDRTMRKHAAYCVTYVSPQTI